MKKVILASALFLSFCFGSELDTSKIEAYWTGYKFANKTSVKGSFKDIKFKFAKGSGISGILTGSTATIDPNKVYTGNPASEKNLTLSFFQKFIGKDIKVKIEKIIEGENGGTVLAKVTMNKKTQLIPMQYEIKNNKFLAKGVLDLFAFKLDEAYKSISEACKTFHKGLTWSQVEIGFMIPLK